MRVHVRSADLPRIIELEASINQGPLGQKLVEYRLPGARQRSWRRTILCFAGGGSSGVVFGRLAELLWERDIQLVSFDMPGHTPANLLGSETPPRRNILRARRNVRRAFSEYMVRSCMNEASGELDVLSHSAGIVDVSQLPENLNTVIKTFWITGAGIPGPSSMLEAARVAKRAGGESPHLFSTLFRERALPSGAPELHFGPLKNRLTENQELARYQQPEHVDVVIDMLSARSVTKASWVGRKVVLIRSAGDALLSESRQEYAKTKLRSAGAQVQAVTIPGDHPHMFMCFEDSAAILAAILDAEVD